jgi:hypothetical protein
MWIGQWLIIFMFLCLDGSTFEFVSKKICPSVMGVQMNFIIGISPKGRRSFFSKKCSNLPFLAQEAQMVFFCFFYFKF